MLRFKLGVEVHVNFSLKKLFCRCRKDPKTNYLETAPIIQTRRFNFDYFNRGLENTTVLFELKAATSHRYALASRNAGCLVELGQAFPDLNFESVREGFRIASFFVNINREIIVMRKFIADGSVSTGYQRTMLLGINSFCKEIELPIESVFLEEDACGVLNTPSGKINFLDRQGVPLLEIVSSPIEFETPQDAANKIYQLGYLLLSLLSEPIPSPIRQDINISIEGIRGKVELKGIDSKTSVEKAIIGEIQRQSNILYSRQELRERNILIDYLMEIILTNRLSSLNLTDITQNLLLKEAIEVMEKFPNNVNILNERLKIFFNDHPLSETRRYDLKTDTSTFMRGKSVVNQLYPETDSLIFETRDYLPSSQRIIGFPELGLQDIARLNSSGLLFWLDLFQRNNYSLNEALLFLDNYQKIFLNLDNLQELERVIAMGSETLTIVLRNYPNIPIPHIIENLDRLTSEEIQFITSSTLPSNEGTFISFLKKNVPSFFITQKRLQLALEIYRTRIN